MSTSPSTAADHASSGMDAESVLHLIEQELADADIPIPTPENATPAVSAKPKWDATPSKHGLYDPRFEIGECGVGEDK